MINVFLLVFVFSITPKNMTPTLNPAHQAMVNAWLQEHPEYRIATEKDCKGCEEQIRSIRKDTIGVWKPFPDYQPYYTVGDFNGDGQKDFAIVAISTKRSSKKFIIIVYNGPFDDSTIQKPAFISEPMNLATKGLFFGPPRPKPHRLIVGPFESEGIVLLPKGNSYELEK